MPANLSFKNYPGLPGIWLISEPVPVPMLAGQHCSFVLNDVEMESQADIYLAIANFLEPTNRTFEEATPHIYSYYLDTKQNVDDPDMPEIQSSHEVMQYVKLSDEVYVKRDATDGLVYLMYTCECAWEPEHGLQINFRQGQVVNKLGDHDDHLRQDKGFEGMVYRSMDSQ